MAPAISKPSVIDVADVLTTQIVESSVLNDANTPAIPEPEALVIDVSNCAAASIMQIHLIPPRSSHANPEKCPA